MEKLEIVNMEKEKVCSLASFVAICFVNHDSHPFGPSGRQSCCRNGKKMWPKNHREQRRIKAILDACSGGTCCSGMHQKNCLWSFCFCICCINNIGFAILCAYCCSLLLEFIHLIYLIFSYAIPDIINIFVCWGVILPYVLKNFTAYL